MSEPCVRCEDGSDALAVFGQRVRTLRQATGIQQQDLAVAAGLTRASIANIEAGRQNTTVTALLAIAAALGTTVGALLGETPGPDVPLSLLARVADQQRRITTALTEAAEVMHGMAKDADEMRARVEALTSKGPE